MVKMYTFKSVTLQIQDVIMSPRTVPVDTYIMRNAEISFGDATVLKADSVSSVTQCRRNQYLCLLPAQDAKMQLL